MALFPMGGERFRLMASHPLSQPSKDAEPSLDELQRIYDQRSHIPARFHDLTWSSWFRINSRMVSRLKVGRLLLGGDAAHIHSPAGAQGMNTGIQDMINLSWKLAMVVNGKARPALLDTYEAERLPVMRGVLFKTDKLTTAIGTENPVVRTLFNHLGPFIAGAMPVQENATAGMSQVALNYRNSSLSEDHTHGGALRAGDRVPDMNVRLRSESRWVQTSLMSALDPVPPHTGGCGAGPDDAASGPKSLSAREPFPGDRGRSKGRGAVRSSFWQRRRRCPGAPGWLRGPNNSNLCGRGSCRRLPSKVVLWRCGRPQLRRALWSTPPPSRSSSPTSSPQS